MRVLKDRIQGAGIEIQGESAIINRAYLVLEIDDGFAGSIDSNALILATQAIGVPRIGDQDPDEPTAYCIGHTIEPISGVSCRIIAHFRTDFVIDFTGQSQVVIEDEIQSASAQTQLLPKTKEPIRVEYVNADPTDPNHIIPPKSAFITYMSPTRILNVRGHTLGRPPTSVYQLLHSVNDADFFGMPKGYWFFAGMRTRSVNRGLSYSVQLQFMSKIFEDWSTYVVSQFPNGQFLVVNKEITDAMVLMPYDFGVFPGMDGDKPAGVTKVGPYEAKSWSVFQFEESYNPPTLGGDTEDTEEE